jgi:Na+/melibiose symporter-like transporter
MDEVFVTTGKHQTGVYLGIRTFFDRINVFKQTVSFVVIHNLTGFDTELTTSQTVKALFGIKIHGAIIPAVAAILGSLILWKFYDIKGAKKQKNARQIEEMSLSDLSQRPNL